MTFLREDNSKMMSILTKNIHIESVLIKDNSKYVNEKLLPLSCKPYFSIPLSGKVKTNTQHNI